jgi:carboxylate-amine ligase
VDPSVGLSAGATEEARAEALALHNLATALDPALIVLTRSCPFYEGRATGLSPRTVQYRGSAALGWEGVYTGLPWAGALLPYAETVEQLVRQQFDRYEAWLAAMDRGGVERHLFAEAGGDILRPAWNPVRLNRQGTVELRGMDSNYPDVTLTAAELAVVAADRVRRESLAVIPDDEVHEFEHDGDTLRVPGFEHLSGVLLHRAVAGETDDPGISHYLDSLLDFAGEEGRLAALRRHRRSTGAYPSTEADILERYGSGNGHIPEEDGLRLVLEACEGLEARVPGLRREDEPEAAEIS